MKRKSPFNTVALDERQRHFALKSFQCGFWFMMFIVWLSIFTNRWLSELISPIFMSQLALYGGCGVVFTYSILNGAHPFVDQRLIKHGKYFGLPVTLFGLLTILMAATEMFKSQLDWKAFFSQGGSGSMLILGLTLLSLGGAILYRNYLNKKEEALSEEDLEEVDNG